MSSTWAAALRLPGSSRSTPGCGRLGARRRRNGSLCGCSRWMAAGWWPRLRHFQLRELRPQRLLPDRTEPHHQLGVVLERLDAEHRPLSKFRVAHADTGPEAVGQRLILVLVGVSRLFLAYAPPSPAVRVRAELRERRLVRRDERGRDFFDQLARDLVDEP